MLRIYKEDSYLISIEFSGDFDSLGSFSSQLMPSSFYTDFPRETKLAARSQEDIFFF
jgi:hypothetical protein